MSLLYSGGIVFRRRCVVVLGVVLLFTCGASAQTFTSLYSFALNSDGSSPYGGVISDATGNLYGTTSSGGANRVYGTVFKLTRNGNSYSESILHSFANGSDGSIPEAGLLMDSSGNLYGTTQGRGSTKGGVFTLNPSTQVLTPLYNSGGGSDPQFFYSPVIMDSAGNLYGTSNEGGGSAACNFGCGTVYMLTKNGNSYTESTLHAFGGSDGARPLYGALLADASGNLYGTTQQGGSSVNCGTSGCGTVFMLAKNGNSYTHSVLYNFSGGNDGNGPASGLIADTDGNLYGTTVEGGSGPCLYGCGTVYKLTRNGDSYTESVLYSFVGGSDGSQPWAGLTMDAAGNLYGTTYYGGGSANCPSLCGTVYMLTKSGSSYSESVLHAFNNTDGAHPYAGLLLDASGTLYGTTYAGGSTSHGTVFALALPVISSPVKGSTLPGSTVKFTWNAKTGATSYQLWLGSTPKSHDAGYISTNGLSGTLGNVPTDGRTLYATLYAYVNSTWIVEDTATYTAATLSHAQITSPPKGSTFTNNAATFTWTAETGATSYQLWLGSTPNAHDLGYVGTSALQASLGSLPTDGRTVYATLWGYVPASGWSVQDTATYTAVNLATAQITSPAKGSVLGGSAVTFTWTAETGATSYQLWAGSTPGGYDITYGGTSNAALTLGGLPTNGSAVYVTLWGYAGGSWSQQDTAVYTAATVTH